MASIGSTREWTAPPLRPVARWIPVDDDGHGRVGLEMRWSVPTVEVPLAASDEAATGTWA